MSATSASNPGSPIQHKDIRSASLPFKRDKEHSAKWSNGQRPLAGVRAIPVDLDETDVQFPLKVEKVRPMKSYSQMYVSPSLPPTPILIQSSSHEHKSHANKTPKQYGNYSPRTAAKVSAIVESNDHTASPLSKSLLELLPQHVNNTSPSISTLLRNTSLDGDVLYSFDNKGPSPTEKGRKVDLGGLVELAEKKWVAEQTDRIVRGEYEVLDNDGEVAAVGKSKKRNSPKQRLQAGKVEFVDDDGFELI